MADNPKNDSGEGSETQGHDVDQLDSATIEFENISTTFDGSRVLDGVSLRVRSGQTTALMGEEQAGKSVLVRHLLGTVRPTQGRVLLNGESVWDMPEERFAALSDGFGMIEGERRTHDNKLDSDRSVLENLTTPLSQAGMNDGEARDKAMLCAREWELDDSADIRADELDTVSRRRLALAQALVADPPVVIIDDPRSAFDIAHIDSEVRSIRGWQHRTGGTILMTTHSIELAKKMADHVAMLRDGRIVAEGSPEELLGDVHTDEDLENHFGTHLSVRETDRGRLRSLLRERNPYLWVLVGVLLVIGIGTIIVMLTSGLLDMGTGGGQGAGNQTMLPGYQLLVPGR